MAIGVVSAAAAALALAFVAVRTDLAAVHSPNPKSPIIAAASPTPAPSPIALAAPPVVHQIVAVEPKRVAPTNLDTTATGAIHPTASTAKPNATHHGSKTATEKLEKSEKHKHKPKKPLASAN